MPSFEYGVWCCETHSSAFFVLELEIHSTNIAPTVVKRGLVLFPFALPPHLELSGTTLANVTSDYSKKGA